MTSILIIENMEPGECELCPVHLRNAGICSLTLQFDNKDCPLKQVGLIEHKERPLSHEKFTKIYVEEKNNG